MDSTSISSSLSQLPLSGDALSHVIAALPFPAHLKDAKTKKYLSNGKYQARNLGFKSAEDLLHLTSKDVHAHEVRIVNQWESPSLLIDKLSKYEELSCALDEQTLVKRQASNQKLVKLRTTGAIIVEKLTKAPVFDSKGVPVAIFTYSEELTHKTDIFFLFHLYKQYYPKQKAILGFLKTFKVDGYFTRSPTDTEVLVLCAMYRNQSYKFAASFLHINPRTIEVHARHLKEKLKSNYNLDRLLIDMRDGHRSTLA